MDHLVRPGSSVHSLGWQGELLLSKQNLHLGRYAIPFAAFFEAQTAVERRSSGIRELQSLHEGKWCHDYALGKRHIELRLAQSNFRCYLS